MFLGSVDHRLLISVSLMGRMASVCDARILLLLGVMLVRKAIPAARLRARLMNASNAGSDDNSMAQSVPV